MSVVERFKNRRLVSPFVEIEISGVKLRIARVSKLELEKAGKIARKELRDEAIEPTEADGLVLSFARAAGLGTVLKDHVKGWDLADTPFSKQVWEEFFQEMSYEEKAELGYLYIKACEATSEEEKKTYDALIQILRNPSGSVSDSTSQPLSSDAESVQKTSETVQ